MLSTGQVLGMEVQDGVSGTGSSIIMTIGIIDIVI
jgi:hypothetical protein